MRRRKNHSNYLNLTPLIDVVFLLLLFFMLSSQLVEEPALRVRLPETTVTEAGRVQALTVTITSEGKVFLGARETVLKDLANAIRQAVETTGDAVVRIRADRDVSVQLLVSVVEQIKTAGVRNISIVTRRK